MKSFALPPVSTFSTRFLVALLLALSPGWAQEGKRVAFVMGLNNFEYLPPEAQLRVAVADAMGMAETLQSLDPPFKVTLVTDGNGKRIWTRDEVWESIERWMQDAREAECALIYVASHGLEYHGQNYLLAGDTKVETASESVETMKRRLSRAGLSLQEMMDELDGTQANVKVVILDACRDNPIQAIDSGGARSVLGGRGGLAAVSAPGGTLVGYSADAGQQANDGLYTEVLRRHMSLPGLTLQEVFAATREEVLKESASRAAAGTGVRHEPAEYTKLNLAGTRFTFTRAEPKKVPIGPEWKVIAAREMDNIGFRAVADEHKIPISRDGEINFPKDMVDKLIKPNLLPRSLLEVEKDGDWEFVSLTKDDLYVFKRSRLASSDRDSMKLLYRCLSGEEMDNIGFRSVAEEHKIPINSDGQINFPKDMVDKLAKSSLLPRSILEVEKEGGWKFTAVTPDDHYIFRKTNEAGSMIAVIQKVAEDTGSHRNSVDDDTLSELLNDMTHQGRAFAAKTIDNHYLFYGEGSLPAGARMSFVHCEQTPEAIEKMLKEASKDGKSLLGFDAERLIFLEGSNR